MNKNQESLKSFYGYKETFGKAAQWVPISKDLTWVHTTNPYDDPEDEEREQQRANELAMHYPQRESNGNELSQADYATFTEGLAALSAVASNQDHFNQSMATMQRAPMQNVQPESSHQHLEYILNPTSRMPETNDQLDPQLQMLDPGQAHSPSSYIRVQSSDALRDAQP